MENRCQGYRERRTSDRYGGPRGSKDEMGNIWEVVSALANALQEARNQLVKIMHTSKSDPMRQSPMRQSPMRMSGGRCDSYEYCHSRSGTPGRACSQYGGMRNVHRAHAHGHVAFGMNSEYPMHVTPRRVRPREIYAQMSAQQAALAAPTRRCTHPLHGIGVETRNLTPRRVQPMWPSGQVKACKHRNSRSDELSRRDRACVNFGSSKNQGSTNCSGDTSPDQRRHHCLAKQFASLLTHEAFQQRERRLAEDALRDKRPSWCRS